MRCRAVSSPAGEGGGGVVGAFHRTMKTFKDPCGGLTVPPYRDFGAQVYNNMWHMDPNEKAISLVGGVEGQDPTVAGTQKLRLACGSRGSGYGWPGSAQLQWVDPVVDAMHRLVIFVFLLGLSFSWLLFALFYLDNPNQHGGHRAVRYKTCVAHCERGCPEHELGDLGVELGWTCSENCVHECEVQDSETRASLREPQLKYSRGRWAFYRFCYMEEFLSAVFSLLNGLPYVYYAIQDTCDEHWLASVLRTSAALHSITWLLSALFHTRPTPFFEHLDYLGVILTCLAEFFTVLLRVAGPGGASSYNRCNFALMAGAVLFGAYAVAMPVCNFQWQIQQLVSQGVLGTTIVLWMWYGVRERHNPLTQHIALPWAFLLFFCVLELVDIPPFTMPGPLYGLVDSHCLWHLVTVPINAWIVYGWTMELKTYKAQAVSERHQRSNWSKADQRVFFWSSLFLIIFSAAVMPSWLNSGQLCLRHARCRQQLRSTWLGSMDLSDPQWRAFREKLPLLFAAALITTALRRYPPVKPVVALVFCIALHGLGAAVFLACFCVVFPLRAFRPVAVGVSWSLALCLLYAKDMEWARISSPGLAGFHDWRLVAKYVALRLISLAADLTPQHTLGQAVDFFFHPALWLAGPLMSLDDFLASSTPQFRFCALYFLRFLGLLLLQEIFLVSVPFFAILRAQMTDAFSARSFASLLYAAINGLWLKFALMWRFFRLWALVDGVEAPENIPRCINTHRTVTEFWQGWHCSFNRWLVRHIYIPLGGRRNRFLSVWVIFFFSAYWHDVSPENWKPLFLWGLLNILHMSLEWAVRMTWSRGQCLGVHSSPWIRNCLECAAGIVTSAFISMTTFVGVLGGQTFLQSFALIAGSSPNWVLDVAGISLVLGCIVQITMALEEARPEHAKGD